jgi:hypothetical protein
LSIEDEVERIEEERVPSCLDESVRKHRKREDVADPVSD